jgi:glycosidase
MKSISEIDLSDNANQSYYPSPQDWEDLILYFLIVDRFSDSKETKENQFASEKDRDNALTNEQSEQEWLHSGSKWTGGTLKGLISKIPYLKSLGISAIWVSPIFQQVSFEETYHGYGIQNFLEVDPHLGSKQDLKELVNKAHKQGIYVILDIILNHTGNVFEYTTRDPLYTGSEYEVKGFRDNKGNPSISPDGFQNESIGDNDGIIPLELMALDSFSRKGQIVNWDSYPEYILGDFFTLKNINTGSGDFQNFSPSHALNTLTSCYKYWISYADIDGFRLDTVKHLEPGATRFFVNEIHEYAKSLGKNNFYILGEITGGLEFSVDLMNKTGIDAALGINKIPDKLEQAAKGYTNPGEFFELFKNSEQKGEEHYKWYKDKVVTSFDDHDMVTLQNHKSRFCADRSSENLLVNALVLNLLSPGIPCIYYGTEQAFDGSGDSDKYVRETMFAGPFGAFRSRGKHFFNKKHPVFIELQKIIAVRNSHIALKQGRLYYREISYDGALFEFPHKIGEERFTGGFGWSRIFSLDEIVIIVNCDREKEQTIHVAIDNELHKSGEMFTCLYSTDSRQIKQKVPVECTSGRKTLILSVPAHGSAVYRKS